MRKIFRIFDVNDNLDLAENEPSQNPVAEFETKSAAENYINETDYRRNNLYIEPVFAETNFRYCVYAWSVNSDKTKGGYLVENGIADTLDLSKYTKDYVQKIISFGFDYLEITISNSENTDKMILKFNPQ